MTAPSVREALERIRARAIADDDADEKELRRQLYHIEALAKDAITNLATPPAPTPSAARERIARIIDPLAFGVNGEWHNEPPHGIEWLAQCALKSADAILALLPDAAAIRAAAFEEAAGVADCLADEYDATSFTSTNADQVAALRSKEQAAHEIAAAIRAAGENEK